MHLNLNRILLKNTVDTPVLNRWLPPVLCGLLFIYYFVVCLISEGYYQHDEVTHLVQILGFWRSPLLYLTDPWSRGGYKLLYAIPALMGYYAIVVTNLLFVVGAAWMSYRIARIYALQYAWLAILFAGLQPFVINLAFRCYPEIPAMFFITLLVYLYTTKRWIGVAIVASFLFTIRAELVVFALLLGGFFAIRKQWIPFLCLGIAPVILNCLGYWLNGDPLYVWHLMLQGGLKDTYQRSGFFYFWLMLPEISGVVIVFLFLTGYLAILYRVREKWAALKRFHAVLIVFTVYFLLHCAFTARSFGFGRSGGVGRFMLVILPMVSVIALIGINFFMSRERTWYKLTLGSIAFVLLLLLMIRLEKIAPLVFQGYATLQLKTYNIIALLLAFLLVLAVIITTKGRWLVAGSLALVVALYTLLCVKPFPTIGEDRNQIAAIAWLHASKIIPRQLYINHPVAYYTYDQLVNKHGTSQGFNQQTIARAQPGDVFVVELHYTDGSTRKEIFASRDFTVINKADADNRKYPAWVMMRK